MKPYEIKMKQYENEAESLMKCIKNFINYTAYKIEKCDQKIRYYSDKKHENKIGPKEIIERRIKEKRFWKMQQLVHKIAFGHVRENKEKNIHIAATTYLGFDFEDNIKIPDEYSPKEEFLFPKDKIEGEKYETICESAKYYGDS